MFVSYLISFHYLIVTSPAAETLRSDWEHCAHMSHVLLIVGDGELADEALGMEV